MARRTTLQALVIVILLIASTAIIAVNGLDIKVARFFYVPVAGFSYGNLQPWRALYQFGEWPGFAMGAAAALCVVAGFVRPSLARFRRQALFVALLLVIGPGILANSVFKDHWGRPRPRQVDMFGGSMAFHQPWQPGPAPKNASFPAGHPTVAFYLSAPYFVVRKKRCRRQALLWLWGGIAYGVIMGMARIIQGGHFVTDVIWSAGFVYLTGLVLAALMRLDAEPQATSPESSL